jgi:hypothetical protein
VTSPPTPRRPTRLRTSLDHPHGADLHTADDAGGVWIVTGVVLCVLVYGLVVLMDVAGFTEVAPLVILPPVVLGLIAANNLLRGGRGYGGSSGRRAGGAPSDGAAGEPHPPR